MVRPRIERKIEEKPCSSCFKPSNAKDDVEKILLWNDEYEAIRLSDLEWLSNREWAIKMWISWATFNRLVKCAHKKLTDAIVNWKCIFINCDKDKMN